MRKRKKRRWGNRREMVCISAVVVVLMCVVFAQSSRLREKNAGYEARIGELNEQIARESERAVEIEELEGYVKTPEYAGEVARQKLGMVGEDEILFRSAD